jgi:hypothetical protein
VGQIANGAALTSTWGCLAAIWRASGSGVGMNLILTIALRNLRCTRYGTQLGRGGGAEQRIDMRWSGFEGGSAVIASPAILPNGFTLTSERLTNLNFRGTVELHLRKARAYMVKTRELLRWPFDAGT